MTFSRPTPPFEVIAEGLAFPEGPVVMGDGSVIVVEVAAGRVTRCWNGRTETISEPGGGPNGAAVGPDGALYICNNGGIDLERLEHSAGPGSEGRIERVDLGTGRVERVYESAEGSPLSAPNDLVFDADGQIWFTDLGKHVGGSRERSALLKCSPAGHEIIRVYDRAISYNGVGISPDGCTVYVADSHQARVYAFDAEAPSTPRFVANVPGDVGLDSLAITQSGNICVARVRQGGIATVSPDGSVEVTEFPDPHTTNIAFGGLQMTTAFITLASSGHLIRTEWPEPGLRLNFNA
jgi:gluconolactonase